MTKRLICLVLSLLMVLAVLTSCSNDEDAIDSTIADASRFTTTLNFWLVTESAEIAKVSELMYGGFNAQVDYENYKELSEEDQKKHAAGKAIYDTLSATEKLAVAQLGAINKAINKITKDQFKTQIKFRYLLESEYYEKLEKAFADREAAKKNGTLIQPEISADETVLNEYGIPELKYPTTPDYQVDIMYLNGVERYRNYADKEWIEPLDAMLEDSALQLSYFMNSTLLNAAKYYGSTFAIPNDHTIGEYVYLAVDTELASAYNYLPSAFGSSLYSKESYDFLNLVYHRADKDIYPLYCDEDVDLERMHYWSFDLSSGSCVLNPDKFSLFGSFYSENNVLGAELGFSNLLNNVNYRNNLEKQIYYQKAEGFTTHNAEDKAAMRVVKGGWEKKAELEAEGYTVLTVESPRVTDESVYSSMFAVSATSSDVTRSMEIITYLNTNEVFRNLLQYGVEEVNYTLKETEDGVYAEETVDNVYKMDIRKTGTIFVAYPDSAENVKAWEYGKEQNRYVLSYPVVNLFFDMTGRKLDETSIRIVNAVSEKLYNDVLCGFASADEAKAFNAEVVAVGDRDVAAMANFLLSKVGEVSYTVDGTAHAITAETLAAALTSMANNTIPEDDPPEGQFHILSPNALYRDWLENSGVLDD